MPVLVKDNLKLVVAPDTSRLLTEISRLLAAKHVPAFIAGGLVRDALLGRNADDIDIAVDADALEVAQVVVTELGGSYVALDGINRIGRIVLSDKRQIDFTTLQDDINHDLSLRDFTINAMALKLNENFAAGDIIDPYGGQKDLKNHIIKAVSANAFKADAARLLRAVRLAAELHFSIDKSTETLISQDSHLINSVAGERLREELLRLLAAPGAGQRLFYMDKLGLLTALFPELNTARGVSQPPLHFWDVFDHSIQTVTAMEFVLREGGWEFADNDALAAVPWSEELKGHFDRETGYGSAGHTMLKLAALFHDIAKPQTKTMDEDRARFLGHPEQGAAAAKEILTRLRFSNREIQLVELLIKYHLRPTQMSNEGLPSKRAVYRLFRDMGEAAIDVLFLSLADHLATRAATLDMAGWREHAAMTAYILEKHAEEHKIAVPAKILDGQDIMRSLGISPGPMVGKLLEALREARAAGEIASRDEALDYVKRLFREQSENRVNLPGERHDKK